MIARFLILTRASLLAAAVLLGPALPQASVRAGIVLPPTLAQPPWAPTMSGEEVSSTRGSTMRTIEPTAELKLAPGRSKLLRARAEVRRTAVADARIADVAQVAPQEVLLLGKAAGRTDVTLWIGDKAAQPMVIVVRVAPD